MIPAALRAAALALLLAAFAAPAAAEPVCVPHPYARDGTGHADDVAGLLDRLAPLRPAFPGLFTALEAQRPEICLMTGPRFVHGFFEVETNRIALHADLGPGARAAILVHELRHVAQFRKGYCASNTYSMEETSRAVMAFEADAMAVTTAAAWALREAGWAAPWAFLTSPDSRYADIAAAFRAAREAGGDRTAAMEAAFAAWFGSDWRVNTYILSSCFDYLEREDALDLPRSTEALPPDYLTGLCTLPDGSGYACALPADVGR